MIPILEKSMKRESLNVAVPRKRPPLSAPSLMERPLVLATHLVPSLPIGLFEVLVEAIEVATEKPVVLLYEPRTDRPVATEVTDIAVMPASDDWKDGDLLPVTFVFKHRMNKDNSPHVYVDVVIAPDRAPHFEGIIDLRGHRCALPDRRKQMGAAGLLFNHLYSRGESPAFFGNTLDADSQIAALQMVAGKQSEIGVLESPVIGCHKNSLPGAESLYTLTSLGPLPPYRIMVNKALSGREMVGVQEGEPWDSYTLVGKITDYLLNIDQVEEWKERFAPFGVWGFVKNSKEYYDFCDMKSVVTRVPYY